jgi:hypothetical protein
MKNMLFLSVVFNSLLNLLAAPIDHDSMSFLIPLRTVRQNLGALVFFNQRCGARVRADPRRRIISLAGIGAGACEACKYIDIFFNIALFSISHGKGVGSGAASFCLPGTGRIRSRINMKIFNVF